MARIANPRYRGGSITISEALDKYLSTMNATEPQEAPNYEFIPYFDDGKEPKNKALGYHLKGVDLKEIHQEYYNKRSQKEKDRIKAFNNFLLSLSKITKTQIENKKSYENLQKQHGFSYSHYTSVFKIFSLKF